MKKLLSIFVLLTSMLSFSQNSEDWQKWEKTSCYSKIQFRLKYEGKNGARHLWKVQFKNEYDNLISFNYYASDQSTENQPTTHRKTLLPKAVSTEVEIYTDTENIYLIVDKVSFSAYPQNFINCE